MELLIKVVGVVFLTLGLIFGIGLLLAFPIKWLWNWLLPPLFGTPSIGFWQAWGIMILSGFLFRASVKIPEEK